MLAGEVSARPARIRLSRQKGWRMPANTVKVTRPGIFGNPFRVTEERTASEAVMAFRMWLTTDASAGIPEQKARLLAALPSLRGKNLACWCPLSQACHAHVLLELANQ